MTECGEAGCERPVEVKGLCRSHYNAMCYQRRKDPVAYAAYLADKAAQRASAEREATRQDRLCTKCGVRQDRDAEFPPQPKGPGGRHSWCKACLRALAKANYDPESKRQKHARLKQDEAYRAHRKEVYDRWRAEHPDRARAATVRWEQANAEHLAIIRREWTARRRALERATAAGRVSYKRIIAEHGMTCHLCGAPILSRADLHFDHVIPLSKGGPHTAENIRPAHALCNMRKGNRAA